MVLSGYEHLPGCEVAHRVVPAVMTEREFECPGAHGQPEYLMAEADPEYGNTAQ